MKFQTGQWVIVTRRMVDGPELEMKGKVIDATPDYAVAECYTKAGPMRFTMSDDTAGIIFFRRAQHSDFRRR